MASSRTHHISAWGLGRHDSGGGEYSRGVMSECPFTVYRSLHPGHLWIWWPNVYVDDNERTWLPIIIETESSLQVLMRGTAPPTLASGASCATSRSAASRTWSLSSCQTLNTSHVVLRFLSPEPQSLWPAVKISVHLWLQGNGAYVPEPRPGLRAPVSALMWRVPAHGHVYKGPTCHTGSLPAGSSPGLFSKSSQEPGAGRAPRAARQALCLAGARTFPDSFRSSEEGKLLPSAAIPRGNYSRSSRNFFQVLFGSLTENSQAGAQGPRRTPSARLGRETDPGGPGGGGQLGGRRYVPAGLRSRAVRWRSRRLSSDIKRPLLCRFSLRSPGQIRKGEA
ncbi:hypothetical protein QTO34_015229 [Cnephaeus nilssonii]|uniref:Uncharacterized protein n=1 Tax=Cnephaeus nilssonii TaxID=3371016 RepID=A0AA40LSW2_CNENI|nr:hypothetical protein QTO34_015229 [Eptesicus nilssonii]